MVLPKFCLTILLQLELTSLDYRHLTSHIYDALFYLFFYINSETVKFGHVTFFWNGNRSGCFNAELEEYVEIPSDSGITFNVQPKMKALEIGEKARDAILSRKFDQVIH